MNFNIDNVGADELLFIPLGGAEEIGLNLNLYRYKGKWLIVDFGAGFADENLPGVDILVPDIEFIEKHKKDILGIVITHAHEDHLGAVQYLWHELRCPIYTTNFTANFLKEKLGEYGLVKEVPLKLVEIESTIQIGPFSLEFVPLSHSAPEMCAIFIRTDKGNVFHTGDWKFDKDPILGKPNNEKKLAEYGKEGVLAVVCDSTNVFNDTDSGSEGDLQKSLIELVASCKKKVVVTTFASNVARIESIVRAADLAGRKIVLAGRSFFRILAAARASGYLANMPEIISDRDINKYKPEQILILSTGCQGEPLAALTKMANGSHPNIRLSPDDAIIFSSKIIPGNEKKIFRILNLLVEHGVEVLTEKDHFVHVSGHPSRDELKRLYALLTPKISIPVHGEQVHIHEHIRLAKTWNVPSSIHLRNGDVVKFSGNSCAKIGEVKNGYIAVDGKCLLPADSSILRMRRRLMLDGVVFVNILINKIGSVKSIPTIRAPGLLDPVSDKELLWNIAEETKTIVEEIYANQKHSKGSVHEKINNLVRGAIRRIIDRETGKNPVIELNFDII